MRNDVYICLLNKILNKLWVWVILQQKIKTKPKLEKCQKKVWYKQNIIEHSNITMMIKGFWISKISINYTVNICIYIKLKIAHYIQIVIKIVLFF